MRDGSDNLVQLPQDHPMVSTGKIGVLLVNLGTPDAPTPKAVKRYLKEFLSDRRIIELNPALWQPILNLVVLNTRPAKSAKAYAKVWREQSNESPLRYYTRQQSDYLSKSLAHTTVNVRWAMRYGSPSIRDELTILRDEGCDRILVMPLYPQFSSTTTASVNDEIFRTLMDMRWQPTLRFLPSFHDHPRYISSLSDSLIQTKNQLGWKPDSVVMSFHGIPKSYFDKGDPYHCHCQKTSRLVREQTGFDKSEWVTCFQSRFGPTQWLKPYTEDVLRSLAKSGKRKILVISPAFISDCIETLEELAIEGRKIFMDAGGEHFSVVPCLNDSPESIALLTELAQNELGGWI